jgi:hypothetical protein
MSALPHRVRRYALAAVVTAAFIAAAAAMRIAPPPLGMADNGDYSRLMRWAGLEHTSGDRSETTLTWFRRHYRLDGSLGLGMPSSSAAFVLTAYVLHRLAGAEVFDILVLGAVHIAAMAFAVWLLVLALQRGGAGPAAAVGAASLAAYILVEPGYLLFFNSFYSEPAVFIGTAGVAAALILCRSESGPAVPARWAVTTVAMLLLLGAGKQQNMLAGLLVLGALLLTGPRRAGPAALAAVALAAVLLPLFWWATTLLGADKYERNITIVNRFHAVYYGLAMVAGDPQTAVARLGLPPASVNLAGKTAYAAESKAFIDSEDGAHAVKRVSLARILWQYLADPTAFTAAWSRTTRALQGSRLDYLGNLTQAEAPDRPRAQAVSAWSWSRWRDGLLAAWPGGALVYACVLAAVVVVAEARGRHVPVAAGLIFLLAHGLTQMGIVILGDGFYEHQKHLGFARFALDLSVPLAIVYVVALWRHGGRPVPSHQTLRD